MDHEIVIFCVPVQETLPPNAAVPVETAAAGAKTEMDAKPETREDEVDAMQLAMQSEKAKTLRKAMSKKIKGKKRGRKATGKTGTISKVSRKCRKLRRKKLEKASKTSFVMGGLGCKR